MVSFSLGNETLRPHPLMMGSLPWTKLHRSITGASFFLDRTSNYASWWFSLDKWVPKSKLGHPYLRCQKLVSKAGTNNYIQHILWGVITYPCLWYLVQTNTFSFMTTSVIAWLCALSSKQLFCNFCIVLWNSYVKNFSWIPIAFSILALNIRDAIN